MSPARISAKVARVNGALYGGEARNAHGGYSSLTSAERFDPITERWEARPDMTVTGDRFVAAIRAVC